MSQGDEAVTAVRTDILVLAKRIGIMLDGLAVRSIPTRDNILAEVLDILQPVETSEKAPHAPHDKVVILNSRRTQDVRDDSAEHNEFDKDGVTNFILNIASTHGGQVSVQQFVDALSEAGFEIPRPSLVVKLHRLVKSQRLFSPATGHFRLSDAEMLRHQHATP